MKVKIAQIQAHVYEEKGENLKELERNLERIKDENIDLVTLGEMFNCPCDPCASGLRSCFPHQNPGTSKRKISGALDLSAGLLVYGCAADIPLL